MNGAFLSLMSRSRLTGARCAALYFGRKTPQSRVRLVLGLERQIELPGRLDVVEPSHRH